MSAADSPVYMLVDPETREAYRIGEEPRMSAPVFFTTRERAEAYAEEEGIDEFQPYPVPAAILLHMKGKPHWVDGRRR